MPQSAVCDGQAQCPAAEDERGCCAPPALRCADGSACLPRDMRCDGDADCADGSDEADCPTAAAASAGATPVTRSHPLCAPLPGAVYCRGRCIERVLVCDGRDHCQDGGAGTDEDPELCCEFMFILIILI